MHLTRGHPRHRAARSAVLLALLLGVPGPAGALPAGVDAAGPGGAGRAGLVLPFDAYRFDRPARARIALATSLLATDCMHRHGFAGLTVPPAPSAPPAVPRNARRYGLADPAVAASHGYHFPPDPAGARLAAGYRTWYAGLPERARLALEGADGYGGCAGAATQTLRRGVHLARHGWFTPMDFRSRNTSAGDPHVRAATARWRACMADLGLRYASPGQAAADPRWDLNSPAPSGPEVAVAVADVTCKRRAGLVRAWFAAETRLQRALIARHAAEFATLAAGNDRYLCNAEEVIARHLGRGGTGPAG